MSAIAGLLRLDGRPADRADVEAITRAMASSGPDGAGHQCAGPIALGHCLLKTTPEASGEMQPLSNESGNLILVFDGRLDNRKELQTEFARLRIPLRTACDAEFVLRAFEAWGKESPKHLLGDFAFAVWDVTSRELFCAIDPMQAAQLYYVTTDRFIAFASFDEALLAVPGVSTQPNEELIAHLLVPSFQTFDPAISWVKQINSLKGGHCLTVASDGTTRVGRYWQFEPGDELRFDSEAEARAEFLAIFLEAVNCRLRASGPVAQMLSGGLDSASIWAAAKQLGAFERPAGYRTYSAISDDPADCKESQCILSIAKGESANFVAVPSFNGIVDSRDLVTEAWSRAHPCDNSILLPALMCLAASRDGARVMLHGASGDVATAVPHKYIAHMMRAGSWRSAWAESVQAGRHNNYLQGTRPSALFLSNLWTAAAPGRLKAFAHSARNRGALPDSSAINSEFARKLNLGERIAQQQADDASARARVSNLRDDQAAMLSGRFGVGLGLAGYARVARRYGMEVRDPWGDRRVVEFFMRLPIKYKIKDGWTKYLVRKSFAAEIPAEVTWRVGKEHLGYQFTARLMQESREKIAGITASGFGRSSVYLNMETVRQRTTRFLANQSKNEDEAASDREFVHDATVLHLMVGRFLGEPSE
jgi:asparagine synthase (glutamine-hydrolysing)